MWKKHLTEKEKEEINEKHKQDIENAFKMIESGVKEYLTSDKYISVLKNISKFHHYSFNNSLLIMMQHPTASAVASFANWKSNFNRSVKKGEKGIKIFVPIEYKIYEPKIDPITKKEILDKDGEPIKEYKGEKGLTYKIGNVFDIEQTKQIEGKEIIPLTFDVHELSGNVTNYKSILKSLINISPVPIEFEKFESNAKGYFSPSTERIVIQPDMSELQTLKTVIHETAHSILHNKQNLQELKSKGIEFSSEDKETQAESVAFIVAYHYGLDTSEYSFPYVATWAENPKLINKNMEIIQKTSDYIIEELDKDLEQQKIKGVEQSPAIEEEELEMEM